MNEHKILDVVVREIGIARTPFVERRDAPFQPGGTRPDGERPVVLGRIEIHPAYRDGLKDLEGFSRVWLLYVFHRNQGFKMRVRPPRGPADDPKVKRGLFATRSPHRPTSVGLTCAKLEEVKEDALIVSEIDLLDTTPVIDVKPYLPYADAFPDVRFGWVEALS